MYTTIITVTGSMSHSFSCHMELSIGDSESPVMKHNAWLYLIVDAAKGDLTRCTVKEGFDPAPMSQSRTLSVFRASILVHF